MLAACLQQGQGQELASQVAGSLPATRAAARWVALHTSALADAWKLGTGDMLGWSWKHGLESSHLQICYAVSVCTCVWSISLTVIFT